MKEVENRAGSNEVGAVIPTNETSLRLEVTDLLLLSRLREVGMARLQGGDPGTAHRSGTDRSGAGSLEELLLPPSLLSMRSSLCTRVRSSALRRAGHARGA
jgi:hypothetical protein